MGLEGFQATVIAFLEDSKRFLGMNGVPFGGMSGIGYPGAGISGGKSFLLLYFHIYAPISVQTTFLAYPGMYGPNIGSYPLGGGYGSSSSQGSQSSYSSGYNSNYGSNYGTAG